MNRIDLPARPRILVVALRRLGDVLLTTPLIRSLRRAWPEATIDALVFADTAGILDRQSRSQRHRRDAGAANGAAKPGTCRRDCSGDTTSRSRRRAATGRAFLPTVAGRVRVGPFEQKFGGRLKRLGLTRSIPHERGVHRVEEVLRLADLIGIARVPELAAPMPRHITGAT